MEKLTLRDAADLTGLSVTTLRRYIRAGRLLAEKCPGRYGPEYMVTAGGLADAGIRSAPVSTNLGENPGEGLPASETALAHRAPRVPQLREPARRPLGGMLPEELFREAVPIDLFRELSMKHEQLLVQYGMVRVGGQKLMEYKTEAERLAEALRQAEQSARSAGERYQEELDFLKKHLRQAELEIEERNQEMLVLREKVRILELISRNAITTESIERQFLQVFDKRRELEELETTTADERRRKMAALDELLSAGFRARPPEPTDQ